MRPLSAARLSVPRLAPTRLLAPRSALRRSAVAVALACLAATSAQAAVTPTGTVSTRAAGTFIGGLGNFLLPGDEMWVGLNTAGTLAVNGGSLLRVGTLTLAQNGGGVVPVTGTSIVTLDGAGSKIELTSGANGGGLGIAGWGAAVMTVSGGATFDGRTRAAAACATTYCGSNIGNTAGSDGTLTVTGAGSSVSLLKGFTLASAGVNDPVLDGYAYGTPGGSTRATLRVLAGGVLNTEGSQQLSIGGGGKGALGTETTLATVVVDGANSLWHVTGSSLDSQGAFMVTATKAGATANLTISNGGVLWIDGKTGSNANGLNLSQGGGVTSVTVSGAASALRFTGDAGFLQVGRSGASSSATLSFSSGASSDGAYYASVGRDGATGVLQVDGAATVLRLNGTASAAVNGSLTNPLMDIGRNGGRGTVNVSNGGRISIVNQLAGGGTPQLNLGRDTGSVGVLNISGAGSTVQLTAPSFVAGGGAAEGFNPLVRVGRDAGAVGSLSITAGGQLLMDGQAVSTVAQSRSTSLLIGGISDTANGGTGTALVTGLGSRILMTGSDTYIGVGHGPQSVGTLTVSDQASIDSLGMIIGRSGGVGTFIADRATLTFAGQQTGNNLAGAFLNIGRSGGTGSATIGNASVMTLTNPGTSGASVNLGGTAAGPLGTGTLTLSGASQIKVVAASGLASVTVGRDGTGTMQMLGASSLDLGDGNLGIARLAGSTGKLFVSGASTVKAGWVGVGRNIVGGIESNGGSAMLIVNDTSTLTANTIVVGSGGLLGGTGRVIGNVTNYGTVSPGNSPGTLTIEGDYTAAAGSQLVLDVQDDGSGGFITDQLVFGSAGTQNLAGMGVTFHFLGSTSPNSFLASGRFGIDTFLRQLQPGGGSAGLGNAAYAGVTFSADSEAYVINNFSYIAGGVASFTAAAVPEPGAGLLWLAGLAAVAGLVRRRRP